MITPAKTAFFVTAYLLVFALIPGAVADFVWVQDGPQVLTWTAGALFLAGLLTGCAAVATLNVRFIADGERSESVAGLWILAAVLFGSVAYITAFGPEAPFLAASRGEDRIGIALAREYAIKLNPDALFVRVYVTARDIFAPVGFALATGMLLTRNGRGKLPALAVLFLAAYVGIWSAQKATIVNYLAATVVFLARDPAHLVSLGLRAAPIVLAVIVGSFLITYADFFSHWTGTVDPVVDDVLEGLIHRLFVSPFEVSMAYVDAINRGSDTVWTDVLPIVGAWLNPGRQSIENAIGQAYFFSGVESISANALAFGYAYVAGGLPFTFIGGMIVPAVMFGALWLVRSGGSEFISRAYAAFLCYLIMDLLTGNFLSYLTRAVEMAVLALLLAVIQSMGRFIRPAERTAPSPPATADA